MKPKIKDGISVIYRKIGEDCYEVNFLLNKSDTAYPFVFNKLSFQLLRFFNGEYTISTIVRRMGVVKEELDSLCSQLEEKGILTTKWDERASFGKTMTPQSNFLSSFATPALSGETMQARIDGAWIVVVGLGGIGTWVVNSLVLAGVTRFTLIDPDRIEASNLNRQCLYTKKDIGEFKVVAMAKKLRVMNNANVHVDKSRVEHVRDLKKYLRETDLVINCADEPSTDEINRIVTRACYPLRIPHILCGGYDGHLGFVGPTIIPGTSSCWMCYERSLVLAQKHAGYKHLIITKADNVGSAIAPISAIVGNIHALEALRVLSGFVKPLLINKIMEIDFLRFQVCHRTFKTHEGCRFCGGGNGSTQKKMDRL